MNPDSKRIFLSPPNLFGNEKAYLAEAVESNYIAPVGPMINRFESSVASFLSTSANKPFFATALSSATAGLDLVCDLLSIGPGDVVLCSDLTFIASIAPAVRRGASPIFIDTDPNTWQLSPDALENALAQCASEGHPAKAVIAVDLYGSCCDYAHLQPVCQAFNVPLIEDAAEALGASFRDETGHLHHAGEAGIAAVFSFNGNKIITSSGGGMLVSSNPDFISQARFLSQQAKDPAPFYEHSRLGYNYRMSNISAAIGLGQFEILAQKVDRRRKICTLYASLLPELSFMSDSPSSHGTRWLSTALLPPTIPPSLVISTLENHNIEARRIWKPMHLQPVFRHAKYFGNESSSFIFDHGICLPSGDSLSDDEVFHIAEIIRSLL